MTKYETPTLLPIVNIKYANVKLIYEMQEGIFNLHLDALLRIMIVFIRFRRWENELGLG